MTSWQPFALTALIVLCIAIVSLCAIPACIRRGCEPSGSLVRKKRREWLEEKLNPRVGAASDAKGAAAAKAGSKSGAPSSAAVALV